MLRVDDREPKTGAARVDLGKRRHAAFIFIFITVLLDMLAIGIIVPVLPKLVVDFLGGDTPRAAEILGVFGTVWALMQFVFSPVQGSLSDRFGRRPVILASNVGLGLDYLLMALAPTLWWLFVGRVISGITAASVSTAFAYVADITAPAERARQMGMIGVAFGIGFVIGPALGGLAGAEDPRLPFYIAAVLSLANALYGYFILPESLPPERRTPFSWRRANPIGSLLLVRRSHGLFGLSVTNFLLHLSNCVLPSVSVLYMTYRYGWDERMIGLTLAVVGVGHMVVQGVLVGFLVSRIGDRWTVILGILFGALSFALMGLAPTGALFLAAVPLVALSGMSNGPLQSLMTQRVGAHEQGQLQGANMSGMGIANMIGPLLFAQVFALSIGRFQAWGEPGVTFFVAAASMAVAIIVTWYATRPSPLHHAGG